MKLEKQKVTKGIKESFEKLRKKGIRPEDIASQLHVSYSSVMSWSAGRRYPKDATLKQIEFLFGVKVL